MEYLMSFSALSQALNGRLFTGEGQTDLQSAGFTSVAIDSRAVLPDALFVALQGSAQDGHRFVENAFKAGASGAIVANSALQDRILNLSALAEKHKATLVGVENTLDALQKAAAVYLEQFPNLTRIGITGSAGKTTTKEITAAIIGCEKSVVMNKGNLNSDIGLPLSVFDVRAHHEVGVFEAGMNRHMEIGELARVLNPHIALITNIGSAHIGILGSRDAIAEEKKKIFSAFSGNNTALIPAEDAYRDFLAKDVRGRIVFYSPASLPGIGEIKDLGLDGSEIVWEGKPLRFWLPGKVNLRNALAAVALALEVPVSAAAIRAGLESVKPLFGRGEIFRGRTTLLRDCYNSSPESAEAAVDFCDSLEWPGRRIYVIGSMLELGDSSDEAHAGLGRRLAESRADLIFLFGEEIRPAADELGASNCENYFYTCDRNELSKMLDSNVKNGDLVLLKGSRGCELESLTGILTEGRGK